MKCKNVCTQHNFIMCPCFDGHIGWLLWIEQHRWASISVIGCKSFVYMPRRGIAWLYAIFTSIYFHVYFLSNCHTDFHSDWASLYSYQQWAGSLFPTHLSQLSLEFFNHSYSDQSEVNLNIFLICLWNLKMDLTMSPSLALNTKSSSLHLWHMDVYIPIPNCNVILKTPLFALVTITYKNLYSTFIMNFVNKKFWVIYLLV